MPRIRDEVLDCSIFLYGSEADALSGREYGGSGFLVAVPDKNNERYRQLYAVTNSHVVEGGYSVIRLNTQEGSVTVLPFQAADWIHHLPAMT